VRLVGAPRRGARQVNRHPLAGGKSEMKRGSVAVLLLALLGCPPPAYVDIFNNTGEVLTIQTPDGPRALSPGESVKLEWHDLFVRWADLDADGTRWPILELELRGRHAEYRFSPIKDAKWVHTYGSIVTVFAQVEPDLTVRIAKPTDTRPVPTDTVQPFGWPLQPLASTEPPANKPLKLTAAGFSRAGSRARHAAW
jgi:hypothetical protein